MWGIQGGDSLWCFRLPLAQHIDESELLYTFARPDDGAINCSFHEGEMLLLSLEGGL
jgi:hypothetical protein